MFFRIRLHPRGSGCGKDIVLIGMIGISTTMVESNDTSHDPGEVYWRTVDVGKALEYRAPSQFAKNRCGIEKRSIKDVLPSELKNVYLPSPSVKVFTTAEMLRVVGSARKANPAMVERLQGLLENGYFWIKNGLFFSTSPKYCPELIEYVKDDNDLSTPPLVQFQTWSESFRQITMDKYRRLAESGRVVQVEDASTSDRPAPPSSLKRSASDASTEFDGNGKRSKEETNDLRNGARILEPEPLDNEEYQPSKDDYDVGNGSLIMDIQSDSLDDDDDGVQQSSPGNVGPSERGNGVRQQSPCVSERGNGDAGHSIVSSERGNGDVGPIVSSKRGNGDVGPIVSSKRGNGDVGRSLVSSERGNGDVGHSPLPSERGNGDDDAGHLPSERGNAEPLVSSEHEDVEHSSLPSEHGNGPLVISERGNLDAGHSIVSSERGNGDARHSSVSSEHGHVAAGHSSVGIERRREDLDWKAVQFSLARELAQRERQRILEERRRRQQQQVERSVKMTMEWTVEPDTFLFENARGLFEYKLNEVKRLRIFGSGTREERRG